MRTQPPTEFSPRVRPQWALVLLGLVLGCHCGPDGNWLEQGAEGQLRLRPGGPDLLPGALLELAPGAEEGSGLRILVERGPDDTLVPAVLCSPAAGLPPGPYCLVPLTAPERPCPRFAEVAAGPAPRVRPLGQVRLTAGALLRTVPAEGESDATAVWARLGPAPDPNGLWPYESLFPAAAAPMAPGQQVDLSTELRPAALFTAAAAAADAQLEDAETSYLAADSSPAEQERAAAHFARADDLWRQRAGLPGLLGEPEPSPEGTDALADRSWKRWLELLERDLREAAPGPELLRVRARETLASHLPALERQAGDDEPRRAGIAALQALVPPPPGAAPAQGERAPERARPAPRRAKPRRPRLTYVALPDLPAPLRQTYRALRAIPVNPDPARFADRPDDELRSEQVLPLLEHAQHFVAEGEALAAAQKSAPEPRLSCRVLFALENVERGAKVYRSRREDIQAARGLARRLESTLLQDGPAECRGLLRGATP